MTYENFNKYLELWPKRDQIVRIRYKYKFEENWSISNEIITYDFEYDQYVWENDWHEGQEDIEIVGAVPIELVRVPSFEERGIIL